MVIDKDTILSFFELVKAGLWDREALLPQSRETICYESIYRLAEEQSVTGLVTDGLEKVRGITVPKEVVLQFVGSTVQIEQKNIAMNEFLAKIIVEITLFITSWLVQRLFVFRKRKK